MRTVSGRYDMTYHHLSEHLVKHDSTGPPVYGPPNRITFLNQLWRHILSGSHIQPRSGFPHPLGNAEVGHHKVAVVSDEKVLRLYIPRDQSVTVDELYRANNVAIVEASIYLIQGSELANQLLEASVGHQFEDEREVGSV
jgi:hypothetical protein